MDFFRIKDILSKNLFWLLLIAVFLFIYFVPIRVSSDIRITGKVFPAKQWVLFAGSNGQIMNTQNDLVAGISNHYETREFSRGDDVRFEINPEILKKSIIEIGDTIGTVYSNEADMLLNASKKQLLVKQAFLKTLQTGEKNETISLAEKELEYARIDAENQRMTFNRQKKLFDQNVIPEQDMEDQHRLLNLMETKVKIKEAELQVIATGEKPENIGLIEAEIEEIEGTITDLERKQKLQTIISPVRGIFRNSSSSDTMMIVESVDELIIKMPISLKDRSRIYEGQKANCTVYGQRVSFQSEVIHISNHISARGGKQTFIITAEIKSKNEIVLPGVVFKGKLEGGKILLRDYVAKWFRFFKS